MVAQAPHRARKQSKPRAVRLVALGDDNGKRRPKADQMATTLASVVKATITFGRNDFSAARRRPKRRILVRTLDAGVRLR